MPLRNHSRAFYAVCLLGISVFVGMVSIPQLGRAVQAAEPGGAGAAAESGELLTPSTRPATTLPAVLPPLTSVPPNRATAERQFNGWKGALAPRKLIANIYYVGASGVSSFLITTPEGHILIDTTFEELVPMIDKNITTLGFKTTDIKYILSSHAHVDHTAGHAAMKKLSGAQIVASEWDGKLLEDGGTNDYSPYPADMLKYTPVKPDRIIKDGDTVTLGGVTLTAVLTPGHTRGATSWLMDITEDGKPLKVIFFSSISIASGTRLNYNAVWPGIIDGYRETFTKLKKIKADVFFGPHGDQFQLNQKLNRLGAGATPNPFIDPNLLQSVVSQTEQSFNSQLAQEERAARNAGIQK